MQNQWGKDSSSMLNEFVTEETYDAWMHRGFGYPGDILFVTEAIHSEILV